ncbi:hypothetical protein ARMSODRAFT_957856 [Armillaria solidipes]|uniref:F-box domain-containing protein n=1 Tax=Armillaria solidipes TaxID=1076256 RepID=A0A2H3C0F7_9AGAR|nr:hypothetical protein ARMSODRAFT_957856 [Armillaria solidipes]
MNLETNLRATPSPPPAADVLSCLDAFIHSIPEPVFPPEDDYSLAFDVLRATRPLLENDRDWILPDIALLEGQLPVYETLIDRLHAAVEELETYRANIQRVSKEFSSTLAPIRRLPIDVLRSVFRETRSYFGRPRQSVVGLPTIKFSHDTLTLGHVCGSWRDIVVSSPELWSHFRITFPSPRVDHPSPLLNTILPLSRPLPLDVRFISESDTSSGEAIEAFFSLLRERHRWRSVSLQIPLDLLEQLRTSSGKLVCLDSLTLMTPRPPVDSRTSPPGDVSDFFIDAPSLRKVVFHGVIERGSFAFPSQITHLAASFSAIHNLHSHSLLEELHLEERRDDGFAFPHRITLPKVRRLSVSSLKMLRHLRLPSLEDLSFQRYFTAGGLPFTHLHAHAMAAATVAIYDFIRSSHCSLTSLATPTSIVYAPNFIQETLPLLKSLTSLEFKIDKASEHRFYNTLMSPNVLPNLQYLVMHLPPLGMEDISQDALSAMLASRSQHLLSVTIECPIMPDFKHVGIMDTLQPLRQAGVDVRAEGTRNLIGIKFGNFA